ncbi:MAG: HD domain-containing protein [Bacilli bacterium]
MSKINMELKKYIEEKVLTLYDNNIGGHGIDHINSVINRSFELVDEFNLDVDLNMVYVMAAFHDIGYKANPDQHEEISSDMFRNNADMRNFFDEKQINIIAEAIIDHRASLEYEARSIYGKIVSSADREISVENMLERSILFQSDKHKEENPTIMQIIDYSYKKLSSKYGKGGYAKMYFQDKKYTDYLNRMQEILENKDKFIEAELQIIKGLKMDDKEKKLVKSL